MRPGTTEIWSLCVCWWEEAVKAGVQPVQVASLGFDPDWKPEYWTPREFLFDRPPSRQDFLDYCKGLFWTYTWDSDVFPAVARSAWPMVDWMHKASHSDLLDAEGRIVGGLRVNHEEVFCGGTGYDRTIVAIPFKIEESITNRLSRENRLPASVVIMKAENRIKESISGIEGEKERNDTIRAGIKKALFDAGLRKSL